MYSEIGGDSNSDSEPNSRHCVSFEDIRKYTMNYRNLIIALSFYALLCMVTLTTIAVTAYNYPLFPFQSDNLEWNNRWLIATVVDYYGACFCFCGIVLSTELTWVRGLAWVAGFCILGSPVCCLWMLLWLWRGGGSLCLERR
mmetsp:Transcript_6071/g.6970  ORF Transcript_6071/g.6970 Transcript_6071/m.6970 type:complete len:142 (-) Transcript_6071:105-530(-)